ncbi:MAG: PEGA domain-containing protein, partial [Methanomicrobiales archaeon]|nr:PEGA domain-containing protein [Methanomicrobiales archaeon]
MSGRSLGIELVVILIFTLGLCTNGAAAGDQAVNIRSDPGGALIFVDGLYTGERTPNLIGISAGEHTITLLLDGYSEFSFPISVVPGNTIIVPQCNLESGSATTLVVSSEPPGAKIVIDGTDRGLTSEQGAELLVPSGNRQIALNLDGYQPYEETVAVQVNVVTQFRKLLTKACQISISSSPPGAAVYLNGVERGTTNKTIKDLSPGTYEIKLILAGYQDWKESITLSAGQSTSREVRLSSNPPSPATLIVSSSPPRAAVYLNGERRGTTNTTIRDLSPGTYEVRLSLSGYQDWKESITLSIGQSISRDVKLSSIPPSYATLPISSSPPGAAVYLDEVNRGTMNTTIRDLAAGTYEVRLSLSGYQDWKESITLSIGQSISRDVKLSSNPPPAATFSISSTPPGAAVYLNGVGQGTTNKTMRDLAPGTYEIKLSLAGYQDYKEPITLSAGQSAFREVRLSSISSNATLSISSVPPGASLYLNEEYRGTTNTTFSDLAAGTYEVKLRLSGYDDWKESITLSAGQSTSREVRLSSIQLPATLSISSSPSGAAVYLNEEYRGTTNMTIRNLAA